MKTQDVMKHFTDLGYPAHVAAGIAGNLTQESSLNPNAVNKQSGATGLAQWLGPRKDALLKFANRQGTYPSDPGTQLDFIHHELNTTETKARDKLFDTSTPGEAATVFSNHFERAGANEKNNTRRISLAEKAMNFVIPTASASEDPYQAKQPVMSEAEWNAAKQQAAPKQPVMTEEEWNAKKRAALQQQPVGDENTAEKHHGDVSSFRYGLNAMRGLGNQALNSVGNVLNIPNAIDEVVPPVGNTLKGWVDTPQEQAQNPGNAIGKFLFDMGLQIPSGGAGKLIPAAPALGRAIASGGISGATSEGDNIDRLKSAGLGILGSLGGEAAGSAVSTLMHPFSNVLSHATGNLIPIAHNLGIPLSAADRTGNKALQAADSALDFIPSSSSAQQAFKDAQRDAWTRALYREGGHTYDPTSQNNLGTMRRAITTSYNDLSARNNLIVDNPMLNQLVAIQGRYGEVLPVDAKRIVNRYIDDLTGQPVIPGNIYQNTRSRLDKQARGMRNSDPFTAGILSEIRDVADNAMARNLSPADKVLWDNTNRNFMVMKHIEKSIDTTTQNISPNLLINEVSRRSPQIAKYGEGPQGLVNIAKVGKQFIAPHIADSGTAQRSYMMKLLTNPLSALTQHGAAGLIGGPIAGVSSLVLPRLATNLMQSPGTYLTHGVQAYTPGRQRILEQLLQSAGAAGANQK